MGGDRLARIFAIDRSTVLRIVANRSTVERYTGFDEFWKQQRFARKAFSTKECTVEYEQACLASIALFGRMEQRHATAYQFKFKHYSRKEVERSRAKKKRKLSTPEGRQKHYDAERRRIYVKRGFAPDEVPERGSYTPPKNPDSGKIRRKRDYLREKVREVWRGLVGDAAARKRVGCSVEEFRTHIKSTMRDGWDASNYGSVWNFDHVIPCAKFDVFDSEQVKRLNHFSNLRACCVLENSNKRDLTDYFSG